MTVNFKSSEVFHIPGPVPCFPAGLGAGSASLHQLCPKWPGQAHLPESSWNKEGNKVKFQPVSLPLDPPCPVQSVHVSHLFLIKISSSAQNIPPKLGIFLSTPCLIFLYTLHFHSTEPSPAPAASPSIESRGASTNILSLPPFID